MKTVPLSVRVSDDDAAFLANLEIAGAKTPSEKLRALLEAERQRQEGLGDRVQATEAFHDLMRSSRREGRQLEADTGLRSDVMLKIVERLPQLAGAVFAGPVLKDGPHKDDATAEKERALCAWEAVVLDEVFALIEETLESGLTTRNRCYDPDGIEKRMPQSLELLELYKLASKNRKETN